MFSIGKKFALEPKFKTCSALAVRFTQVKLWLVAELLCKCCVPQSRVSLIKSRRWKLSDSAQIGSAERTNACQKDGFKGFEPRCYNKINQSFMKTTTPRSVGGFMDTIFVPTRYDLVPQLHAFVAKTYCQFKRTANSWWAAG